MQFSAIEGNQHRELPFKTITKESNMLKLQIVLVPPSALRQQKVRQRPQWGAQTLNSSPFARELGSSTPNTSSVGVAVNEPQPLRKFLHITRRERELADVAGEITARFVKLYPDDEPLQILKLQDVNECDLDPDYVAGDIFDVDNIVYVVLINEIGSLDAAIDREAERRGKRRPSGNLSALVVPKKRALSKARENVRAADTAEVRRSTPLANQVFPALGNNSDRSFDLSVHEDSEVSLPPPEDDDTRYEDPLKLKPVPVSPSASSRRVTSGMLVAPEPQLKDAAEATLHEQEIDEKLASKIPVKKDFAASNVSSPSSTKTKVSAVEGSQHSIEKGSAKKAAEKKALVKKDGANTQIVKGNDSVEKGTPLKGSVKDDMATGSSVEKGTPNRKTSFSDTDDEFQEARDDPVFTKEEIIQIMTSSRIPSSVRKKLELHSSTKLPHKAPRPAALAALKKIVSVQFPDIEIIDPGRIPTTKAYMYNSDSLKDVAADTPSKAKELEESLVKKDAPANATSQVDNAKETPLKASTDGKVEVEKEAEQKVAEKEATKETTVGVPTTKPPAEKVTEKATAKNADKVTKPTAKARKTITKAVNGVAPVHKRLASDRFDVSKLVKPDFPVEGLAEIDAQIADPNISTEVKDQLLVDRGRNIFNAKRRYRRKLAKEEREKSRADTDAAANVTDKPADLKNDTLKKFEEARAKILANMPQPAKQETKKLVNVVSPQAAIESNSNSDSDSDDSNDSNDSDSSDDEPSKTPRIVNTPKSLSQPAPANDDLRKKTALKADKEELISQSQPATPAKNSKAAPKKKLNNRKSLSSLQDLVLKKVPDVHDSLTPTSARGTAVNKAKETPKQEQPSSDESTSGSDSDSDSDSGDDSSENQGTKFLSAKAASDLLGSKKKSNRVSSAFRGLISDAKSSQK